MPETQGDTAGASPPWSNVVWAALHGPQAALAESLDDACRYQPDVAPFAALPDDPLPQDWESLRELSAGGLATLFRLPITPPEGWTTVQLYPCYQMVAARLLRERQDPDLDLLGPDDVEEMIDLVQLTQPGPFFTRTIEMGEYFGVHREGRLVAMAGERFRFDGATEVSAVCTNPDFRNQGLGHQLIAHVVARIQARGEVPFLHVVRTNPARLVYDDLGFLVRSEPEAVILAPPWVVPGEVQFHAAID